MYYQNIENFLSKPQKCFRLYKKLGLTKWISDETYISKLFFAKMGYQLDLENPHTFNEKLQWLKLYEHKPEYTKMVDKYAVKEHVSTIIGKEYVIPTLRVWNNFDEIDFEVLPERFVLKCTHDSGGLVIVKNKNDFNKILAKNKIEKSLKRNYFYQGREWPYKNVQPRIIAEMYISDADKVDELTDYKFFCFAGEPRYCQVIKGRFKNETIDFYDMKWKHQEFTGLEKPYKPHSAEEIPVPVNFEKMKEFAAKLSSGISFVRIDFYEASGKLYFGETTFYPASGFGEFDIDEWNYKMGDMIKLPTEKRI